MARLTPDLCEDRAWLDGFRAGDRGALERVFRSYAPVVFEVIRGGARLPGGTRVYLRNASEEDDVMQDTFTRLLLPASRSRYDGLRPYGALVRTVARNALVDHLRKVGRISAQETPFSDEEAVVPDGGPPAALELLLSQEEAAVANALLESLKPDERRLAAVRFEEGLSQRDAAEALGVSRQQVRTLESRLMEKAKAFLKARGWGPAPRS